MPERELRGIRLRNKKGKEPTGDKPEGTYTMEVWCNNCEWEGEVELPKGTAVPWEAPLERLARCENCGCETLERYAKADEEEEVAGPGTPLEVDDELFDFQRALAEHDERERRSSPAPRPAARPPRPWMDDLPLSPTFRRPPGRPTWVSGDSISGESMQRMQDAADAFEYSYAAVKTDYTTRDNQS